MYVMNPREPLDQELDVIGDALKIPDATEVCFNGVEGVVFVSTSTGFQSVPCPRATNAWALGLFNLVGTHNEVREVSARMGTLEGRIPHARGVLRAAFFADPVMQNKRVSFTIRIPSQKIISLDELFETGFFDEIEVGETSPEPPLVASLGKKEKHLLGLIYRAKQTRNIVERRAVLREFFLAALAYDQRICLCGRTDTGKTTLAKALVQYIPHEKRIIVVETVPELLLPNHPNVVFLSYDQNNQSEPGKGPAGPMEIINGILRYCPDVVLPAEVRDEEAFPFLVRLVDSGHGGMVFTCHATRVERVYPMLAVAAGRHPDCKMSQSELEQFFRDQLEVVVSFDKHSDASGKKRRFVKEIKYIYE